MLFQNETNLKRPGKNGDPVRKLAECRSEKEIVGIMLDEIGSHYCEDRIMAGFLSLVKRDRKEAFLYLSDPKVEKTSDKAERHFPIQSWLLKHRFKTKEGVLRTFYLCHELSMESLLSPSTKCLCISLSYFYMSLSRKEKTVISVIIAFAMISASFAILDINGNNHGTIAKPVADLGPRLDLSLAGRGNLSPMANVTESVQIMGVDPSYLWSAGSSPYGGANLSPAAYMNLFKGSYFPSLPGNMTLKGFLNDNFSKIVAGWKEYYQKEGSYAQSASLTIESTFSVVINGNLSVFSYYNNLPFSSSGMSLVKYGNSTNSTLTGWFNGTAVNPSSYQSLYFIPVAFNLTPSFDLASPAYTAQVNNTSSLGTSSTPTYSPDRIIGKCDPGTWYVAQWTKTLYGPDPMVTVHINGNYPPENNFLGIEDSLGWSSVEMYMNSDQTGVTSGGSVTDQMSTSPSWSGTGNFGGGLATWVAYPDNSSIVGGNAGINDTSAIIYISNATFSITHYNIYYVWGDYTDCHDIYLGNTTSVELASINASNGYYKIGYGFVPIEFYYVLQNITSGSKVTNLGSLPGAWGIEGGQIWGDTTGYSNGARVIADASKAMSTFAAALGVAVAFIDFTAALNGVDYDASESAVVDTSLGLIDASLGLKITLVADFSSISFSTDSPFGLYDITSEPGNSYAYNLTDFQSPNPVTFSLNGNNYQFTAPSNFIVAL